MMLKLFFYLIIFLSFVVSANAQNQSELQQEIREMSKLKDPEKAVKMKEKILKVYALDTVDDAETIDMLNGIIAVDYASEGSFLKFYEYINFIKNRFNQTSMMNMAAGSLMDSGKYLNKAVDIAKETIERYYSFKDDPSAKPANFDEADWKRFMNYAQYPYYDTYARALYFNHQYDSALLYQRKSFDGLPEEAIPSSAERYVRLLELTGRKKEAKKYLYNMAVTGKLTGGMIDLLKQNYIDERGSVNGFNSFLDSIQISAQQEMYTRLRGGMLSEAAPLFTLKNLKGEKVSLNNYKGKLVVLDLWATWCAPCIASFPAMQKLVDKHKEVEFLFIVVDEKGPDVKQRVQQFITKNNYRFHVLLDAPIEGDSEKYMITSSYRPNGIPAKYFIDKKGILRFKSKGFDTESELMNEVEAMIKMMNEIN